MKFQVKDHEGNPLQGEVIVGDVSEFEGGPPATTIGSFLPRRAVTDQNGIATFAFVIDRSAPAGAFRMRFSLPQFFGADGKPISASISGTVRDLVFKPRGVGDTEINYDDPSRAGQGQVGVPGTRLGVPLRGRIFGGQGGITFKIIEGNGSWEAGDEGELDHITVEDCGKISASIQTVDDGNNNGTGNIRFIPSTSHALIAMEGFTDIFAVGPPEIEIIDADSLKGISFVEPTQEPSAGQQKAFLLEFRLPVGFQESVRASLQSFDHLDAALSLFDGAAPALRDDIEMSIVQNNVEGRYSLFRSAGTPFVAVDRRLHSGESPPAFGSLQALQVLPNGYFVPTLKASLVQQGARQEAPRVIQSRVVHERDSNIQLIVSNVADTEVVQWKIESISGDALSVTPPNAKNRNLWLQFGPATDATKAGTSADPVLLKLTPNNANRRATFKVTTTIGARTLDPIELRVSGGDSSAFIDGCVPVLQEQRTQWSCVRNRKVCTLQSRRRNLLSEPHWRHWAGQGKAPCVYGPARRPQEEAWACHRNNSFFALDSEESWG